jgi:hypothetical protein
MKNEFVPYDIALAMKELGFDEPCLSMYMDKKLTIIQRTKEELENMMNTPISKLRGTELLLAPLYQQAFRWFREEHNTEVIIIPKFGDNGYGAECFKNGALLPVELLSKHNYREAQDACLRKLIEIVNQNKDENC